MIRLEQTTAAYDGISEVFSQQKETRLVRYSAVMDALMMQHSGHVNRQLNVSMPARTKETGPGNGVTKS